MSLDPYNSTVREYFAQPAHAGDVEDGAVATLKTRACVFGCRSRLRTTGSKTAIPDLGLPTRDRRLRSFLSSI